MDQNDKLSIKNLLFFRAIPNYKIPIPTDGYKLYTCTDCSDRFILESSYEHHVNRKSVMITYNCRSCNSMKTFYNRCNLLSHIRSHTFKTATINVSDLTVSPLPLSFFKFDDSTKQKSTLPSTSSENLNTVDGADKQKQSLQSTSTEKLNTSNGFNKQKRSLQSTSSEKANPSDSSNKQKRSSLPTSAEKVNPSDVANKKKRTQSANAEKPATWLCFDCRAEFTTSKPIYKDRARHYMQFTNEVYTCPVCLFALPTACALKAHVRLHTNSPPFYCPECGQHLPAKSISYPFNHNCKGFNMMRATARLECKVSNCNFFHPNDIKEHFKKHHFNKVFKCQTCVVACFNEQTMQKHIKTHHSTSKSLVFFQCVLCPGRLVLQGQIDNHLRTHDFDVIYPCWECGLTHKNISSFIKHHIDKHCQNNDIKNIYISSLNVNEPTSVNRTYRVIKRCEQCKRSFTYKCKYDEIQILPNECPYKCTLDPKQNVVSSNLPSALTKEIVCPLCKERISENWEVIKEHYATNHKSYRCVDMSIVLEKIGENKAMKYKNIVVKKKRIRKPKKKNASKQTSHEPSAVSKCESVPTTPSKSQSGPTTQSKSVAGPSAPSKSDQLNCSLCDYKCNDKQSLDLHILNHRDPYMAYQCMECGKSFAVKPSFSTHLLVEHNIANSNEYIQLKQCYNENAMEKYINRDSESNEPLQENQCKICREQFENSEDLEKHFRVHGMAFLLQSTSNKSS